tara:strand:- start:805 stop:1401 length:597 start_codon:yes stop_codon:yes gene_type:complete
MILTEITSIPSGALPFYNFKNHLRMGTGFAEADLQDPLLEAYLRAAIATIEGKLGLAIIERSFSWNLTTWHHGDHQNFPIRPVKAITSVTCLDRFDVPYAVDSGAYVLIQDSLVPAIKAVGGWLPRIPTDGTIEIEFLAGYGANWDDVPADLAQAVLLLASYFYENRIGAPLASGILPVAVSGLIEPYRVVRVSGTRP